MIRAADTIVNPVTGERLVFELTSLGFPPKLLARVPSFSS